MKTLSYLIIYVYASLITGIFLMVIPLASYYGDFCNGLYSLEYINETSLISGGDAILCLSLIMLVASLLISYFKNNMLFEVSEYY